MQEDDLKIDVGDADEQETEIDLDAAPQEEQAEEKPEIEMNELALMLINIMNRDDILLKDLKVFLFFH